MPWCKPSMRKSKSVSKSWQQTRISYRCYSTVVATPSFSIFFLPLKNVEGCVFSEDTCCQDSCKSLHCIAARCWWGMNLLNDVGQWFKESGKPSFQSTIDIDLQARSIKHLNILELLEHVGIMMSWWLMGNLQAGAGREQPPDLCLEMSWSALWFWHTVIAYKKRHQTTSISSIQIDVYSILLVFGRSLETSWKPSDCVPVHSLDVLLSKRRKSRDHTVLYISIRSILFLFAVLKHRVET